MTASLTEAGGVRAAAVGDVLMGVGTGDGTVLVGTQGAAGAIAEAGGVSVAAVGDILMRVGTGE